MCQKERNNNQIWWVMEKNLYLTKHDLLFLQHKSRKINNPLDINCMSKTDLTDQDTLKLHLELC